jgi:hypothetical protein
MGLRFFQTTIRQQLGKIKNMTSVKSLVVERIDSEANTRKLFRQKFKNVTTEKDILIQKELVRVPQSKDFLSCTTFPI